ncbi:probable receptor-like protein kinase At1g49730 isoform X3 [Malania oleifera]|uniref:probable receptor-like protein kinase At1g49730 isoform X3 n=1 Tax=Malania oleifera TaxID=397392 RepID=UPI0025ADBE4C|nr:probable receptor-like protein kinase At1g49730 isoform X3 [Malania oleifera]
MGRRLILRFERSRPDPVSFVRRFSYRDIKRATGDFCRIIESCSQGGAYKASFQDGTVAVVKEVRALSQGEDVFHREVQLLAQLHHRHLVALQGFSLGHKRFLVFEKTENGSLKEHLSDPLKTPLNWRTRLQIAIGVAAALEYLHFFCDPPIYHVSISSNNIMLDENFAAKLSDVGLLSSDGNRGTSLHSSCSEDCMGQKCGNTMFQLGVLILELVTGQSSEKGGTDIIQWVQESCFGITIDNMIDPDLGNNYDPGELRSLLAVARFCLKSRDKPTYSVSHILRYLQKKLDSSCNAF